MYDPRVCQSVSSRQWLRQGLNHLYSITTSITRTHIRQPTDRRREVSATRERLPLGPALTSIARVEYSPCSRRGRASGAFVEGLKCASRFLEWDMSVV